MFMRLYGFMDGELLKDHGREDVFLKGMQFMVVHALLNRTY